MKSARLINRLNVKIKFIKYVINQYFICACGEIGRHARFRLCYYSVFNYCDCRQVKIRQKKLNRYICTCGEIGIRDRFRLCYYSAFNFCGCRQVEIRQKNQIKIYAPVVKLADTLDLGSNSERNAGSSPVGRTNDKSPCFRDFLLKYINMYLCFEKRWNGNSPPHFFVICIH